MTLNSTFKRNYLKIFSTEKAPYIKPLMGKENYNKDFSGYIYMPIAFNH